MEPWLNPGNGVVDWRHWPGWSQLFKGDDSTGRFANRENNLRLGLLLYTIRVSQSSQKGRLKWRSHAALQPRTNYICIASRGFGAKISPGCCSVLPKGRVVGPPGNLTCGCPHHGGRSRRKPVSESRVQPVQPITEQSEATGRKEGCVIFFTTSQRGRLSTWN